jgi:hypothetical protein
VKKKKKCGTGAYDLVLSYNTELTRYWKYKISNLWGTAVWAKWRDRMERVKPVKPEVSLCNITNPGPTLENTVSSLLRPAGCC